MNYFPDLVLEELFSFFSFKEKFKLKLVCKKWMILIERQSSSRLAVIDDVYFFRENWSFNGKRIQEKEIIGTNFFIKCLRNNYFGSLKALYFYKVFNECYYIKNKDILVPLIEKLETFSLCDSFSGFHRVFQGSNFKNLRTLCMKDSFTGKMFITAPNLEELTYWNTYDFMKVGLSNPEKIKFLECTKFNKSFQLNKFLNLEHLICQQVDKDFALSNYPKLKKLNLYPSEEELDFANYIIRQKKALGFKNLKISISGFDFDNENFICFKRVSYFAASFITKSFYHLEIKDLELIKNNFSKFNNPFPWDVHITINSSCDYFCFSSMHLFKMNVRIVKIDSNVNPKFLVGFFKVLYSLDHLILSNRFLTEDIIHELASIKFILILEISMDSEPLNLNFLNKFKFLPKLKLVFPNEFSVDYFCDTYKKSKGKNLILYNQTFYSSSFFAAITLKLGFKTRHFRNLKDAFLFLDSYDKDHFFNIH